MEKESYGAPLMKKLILEAQSLGIKVSANRDLMTGLWVVVHDGSAYTFPTKAGVSAACWFIRGMTINAQNQISVMLAVQDTRL
jgi:hypothetical protein